MKIVVSNFEDIISRSDIIESINKFVKAGNMFIIATNKAMNYLAEELSLIDLNCEYYICNDGAVIFDRYFNVVYRKDILQELVRPIFNYLQDEDNILETFIDTSHGYVNDTSKSANGIIARAYDSTKGSMTLDYLIRKYPDIHGNISDNWINIIDKSVSKASALDYLVNTYNYNEEDIYVVGIGLNDYTMVEKYNGYTYEHSLNDLKTISKDTILDLNSLIEKLNFNEEENNFDIDYVFED